MSHINIKCKYYWIRNIAGTVVRLAVIVGSITRGIYEQGYGN